LSEALSAGLSSPEEVESVARKYNCKMERINVTQLTKYRHDYQKVMSAINRNKVATIKVQKASGGGKMRLTDEIREYVCKNYIEPARERGQKEITIRAGDIHNEMGLVSRMPAVCSALGSKMDKICNVEILKIDAPPSGQGANFYVTYKILSKELPRPKVMVYRKKSQADEIRAFVQRYYIEPARRKGQKRITINAGEVDRKMRLRRVPNVNNVLGGRKLQMECNIKLIETGGTLGSTTATYTYEILGLQESETELSDIGETTQGICCPSCGYDNDPENRFCEECGSKLNVCPNCGNDVKPTSKFCGKCGTRL
jgi:hypothetical protein